MPGNEAVEESCAEAGNHVKKKLVNPDIVLRECWSLPDCLGIKPGLEDLRKGEMTNVRHMAIAVLVCASASAFAQTLTARSSTFSYFTDYGHGGDFTIHAEDFQTYTDLEAASTKSMVYNDSVSGTYLNAPWQAAVGIDLNHNYTLNGTLGQFDQIDAALHSSYMASYSGAPGVGAGGQSRNPGNELILEFTVATDFSYEFLGSYAVHSNGAGTHARVELQKWNGTSWAAIQNGVTFNGILRTGNATAGSYRIYAATDLSSIAQDTATGDVSVMFRNTSVPEPASLGLLALAIPAILRRKKR